MKGNGRVYRQQMKQNPNDVKRSIAKQLKTQLLDASQELRNEYGIGEKFEKTLVEYTKRIEEYLLKNVYIPIKIFADRDRFYFVDDQGIIVYANDIRSHGVSSTVREELSTLDVFINLIIALSRKDERKIMKDYCDVRALQKFFDQCALEMKYKMEHNNIKINIG